MQDLTFHLSAQFIHFQSSIYHDQTVPYIDNNVPIKSFLWAMLTFATRNFQSTETLTVQKNEVFH